MASEEAGYITGQVIAVDGRACFIILFKYGTKISYSPKGGESVELLDKVKQIIADQLGIDEDEVTPEASFIDDLGADLLDIVGTDNGF